MARTRCDSSRHQSYLTLRVTVSQAMRLKAKTLVWPGIIAGALALCYAICRLLRFEPLRLDESLLCLLALGGYVVYTIYRAKVEATRHRIDKLTRLHLATIEAL